MRTSFLLLCLALLMLGSTRLDQPVQAATPGLVPAGEGSELLLPPQDHMTEAEFQAVWTEIDHNRAQLYANGQLHQPTTPQVVNYDWPVRMAPGLTDYAGFYVSAFSDHNSTIGALLDYNNGVRTYDSGTYNHQGTDIALWPFSWNKVNAGEVQVVAAAAGTVIANNNVTAVDHNCGSGSGSFGNWIALEHGDGRVTIYGHMRYNSLTPKGLGEPVAAGEYLGTVASSGNSTGPHLHFELRAANGSTIWNDPYTGPANPVASSWNSQPAYYDSAVNKVATGTGLPVFVACQPTTTNLQDSFVFTTTTRIYFDVFYRDYQGALWTLINIYTPSGDLYQTSGSSSATTYASTWARYWYFDFPATVPGGTWRFEALYNGHTYSTSFTINASAPSLNNRLYLPSITN